MQNPYAPPAATDAKGGENGVATIADRYAHKGGLFKTKMFSGKVYANERLIAMCGNADLSKQSLAAQFGLIGILIYYLTRSKKPAQNIGELPENVRDQLAFDKVVPIHVVILAKADIEVIKNSWLSGLTVVSGQGKFSLTKGLMGGKKQIVESLTALGYRVG